MGGGDKGSARLSACQQQSSLHSDIDYKERSCVCVCECVAPCEHQLPVDLLVCQVDKTKRQRRAGGAESHGTKQRNKKQRNLRH